MLSMYTELGKGVKEDWRDKRRVDMLVGAIALILVPAIYVVRANVVTWRWVGYKVANVIRKQV